jgi:hypothetical protein
MAGECELAVTGLATMGQHLTLQQSTRRRVAPDLTDPC